jgi:hypothetical protein
MAAEENGREPLIEMSLEQRLRERWREEVDADVEA